MKTKNLLTVETAWLGISPWMIIGAMIILGPIFVFMTLDSIEKQKEHTTLLFMEKGDALIRSLEAGVRTGMMDRQWDLFHLQKQLMETAEQPDIDYITVTDSKGVILADSDPSLIGELHGEELELDRIAGSKKVEWRQVPNPDGVDTFEVFRSFSPENWLAQGPVPRSDHTESSSMGEGPARRIIFIGLNMGPIEAARKEAVRHTVLMAVILLLIGFSGVVTLFLAQGYRAARTSFSRIKAFSDNIVENMPLGLVALDSRGKIISFNQAAESILRHESDEVLGKNSADILPPPIMELIDAQAMEGNIVAREIECPVAEGKTIPLEVIAAALKEDAGTFMGHIVLFRDLTEVQHLKREIARSQRLASLGSLAAGIAHEIRNPLSSIKGFATYFKERYKDNPADGETADIMVQETERLNRVIGRLLDFARPVAVDKKRASIQSIIRHSLRIIEGQARAKNITIRTDLADIPDVAIDEDKIKQALLNLYLNALEAMAEEGKLDVRLSQVDGRTINITISDTGTGMGREEMSRIFDPYFTTKPSGTGLGLSIVHKIVEAHDGEIRVASTPQKGTAISLILPIIREKGGH